MSIKKMLFLSILLISLSFHAPMTQVYHSLSGIQRTNKALDVMKDLKVNLDYGKIPLYFIPNQGQVDAEALFYAKASQYTLWLTNGGFIFENIRRMPEREVSEIKFVNTTKEPKVIPIEGTEHRVNCFIGGDESKWRTGIRTTKAVLYQDVYENIDLKVHGVEREIEYDWVVKPGGEVENIQFDYRDIKETRLDKNGNLEAETGFGKVLHRKPVGYQMIQGERIEVDVKFKEIRENWYGFEVESYSKEHELIIDPVISMYSTYLGGVGSDRGYDIIVSSTGNAYVTGHTASINFPKKNAYMNDPDGSLDDVFVTKFSTTGSSLVYSTYLGGTGNDVGRGIAVDDDGSAYVTGYTGSTNFPMVNAYMNDPDGSLYDAFVTKLSASGSSLVYSTYLGGIGSDEGYGIALDGDENAYVTGYTGSTNFPWKNAYMSDPDGSLYDAFVTKLSSSGSSLVYSTYLGGTGNDVGRGIAVDGDGSAYVTGYTGSINFPMVNAYMSDPDGSLYDAFVTKLSASGSSLAYSTYLGGTGSDEGRGIEVDGDENAYVTGYTGSINFPMVNAYISDPDGSFYDAFVTKFSKLGGNLIYSTYLGGMGNDEGYALAVAMDKSTYVTGYTGSINFPMVNAYMSDPDGSLYDAFVTKLSSCDSPPEVAIIYPSDSSTVSGIVTIQASATDDYGIVKVDFYIDGDLKTTDTASPYEFDWDTINVSNGNHNIEAVAYDTINQTDSDDIDVTVNNVVVRRLTISAQVGGTTDPAPGNHYYDNGESIEVDALPNPNYNFSNWSGDIPPEHNNDNPLILIMDSDKSIQAHFISMPGPYNYYIVDGHDFDGNGTSDISLYRPTYGMWHIKDGTSQQWGASGDIPVQGNYDLDASTEIAVFRPSSGLWFISGISTTQWGASGDIPVPHDYSGDGVTDLAVWRPSDGIWYVNGVGNYKYGQAGDYPVPGDYDGNGTDEIAVWRPAEGAWYISGVGYYQWGGQGDIPVPADYNGDGKTDLAVFRPLIGMWHIQYMGGGTAAIPWGMFGDIPVPGDYDGDGTMDVAIWRPSDGLWYIYGNGTYQWGQIGDIPLVR